MEGGLIVQVLGELSNNGGAWHKFSQTFFLAEQPQGYYVLNDIFRFLKEDIDPEYEMEKEEVERAQFTYQDAKTNAISNLKTSAKESKRTVSPTKRPEKPTKEIEKASVAHPVQEIPAEQPVAVAPSAAESHPVEKVQAKKEHTAPKTETTTNGRASPTRDQSPKKQPSAPLA
jgi:hypothetical protein